MTTVSRRSSRFGPSFLLLATLSFGTLPASAQDSFALKGGERIVFFGDSITQGGQYVTDVEFFLLTRFPDRSFTVINHGISSETISGTSEPDHDPRRPDAHDRFTRDITAWKPDVVVACFGMNDGNYFPFESERFGRYQAGVRRLIERTRDEAHARLFLLTPPTFDPYRRQASDPTARQYGYRFPAIDYDATLGRYAEWLLSLRSEGLGVGDVHSAFANHLQQRRVDEVSFFLSGDAVHPGPTGHWLMAQTLLETWGAPGVVAEANVDARGNSPASAGIQDLQRSGRTLTFRWTSPLPFAFDAGCDARSLALERSAERLNRYSLTIKGLEPGSYRASVVLEGEPGEAELGRFSAEALAKGLDLSSFEKFPTVRVAREVRASLTRANGECYGRWRKRIADPATATHAADDPEKTRILDQLRGLCQPRTMVITLEPSEGP